MDDPTRLIRRAASGDREAHDEVFLVLRPEMERIAIGLMRRESREVTMQAGVLISELYLKLRTAFEGRSLALPGGEPEDWESREQFLRYATTAMKSILLDSARRRAATKRGGDALGAVVTDKALELESPPELLLFFDEAVERLRDGHPEQADLLEMVRFGGLSPRSAGAALGLSRRKTEEVWTYLQAWLAREWGLSARDSDING
ncbi:MAG: ECF-type sigma factor [Planctomycetota bacterium]